MIYNFSNCSLDVKNHSFYSNKKAFFLEPRIFALLCYLCENSNKAITREELIVNVWGNRVVSDAAINRAISELRKALPVNSIETIPKVGYKFNHPVKAIPTIKKSFSVNFKPHLIISLTLLTSFLIFILFLANYNLDEINSIEFTNSKTLDTQKHLSYRGKYALDNQTKYYLSRGPNSNTQIWSYNSKSDINITNDDYYYLDFVHKNKKEIIASRFNNLNERKCEIVLISMEKGSKKHLLPCSERGIIQLDFDREKNRLFFNHRPSVNAPFSIYSYALNNKRIKQISYALNIGNAVGDFSFDYENKSNRLVILEYMHSGSFLVKLVDLNTGEQSKIVKLDSAIDVEWLDSNSVLVSQGNKISWVDVDKKIIKTEIDSPSSNIDINKDKSKLLTHKFESINNIYKRGTEKIEKITSSDREITNFDVNNEKNMLVYKTGRHFTSRLWLKNINSKAINISPNSSMRSISSFKFNSNASKIAAVINNTLEVYDIEKKQWQSITEKKLKVHHIGYFNGSKIILSANSSSDWQIYSLNLKDKSLEQMTKYGGYSSQFYVEDNTIVYSKFNEDGLFLMNSEGEEEKLYSDFKLTSWRNWQLVGNKILILNNDIVTTINLENAKVFTEMDTKKSIKSVFTKDFEYFYLKNEDISSKLAEYDIKKINTFMN